MGIPTRQELEINEDYSFHRKMWVVQRVGWLLMAVFIAATMAGVFGLGGWASTVEKKNSWGTLKYDRFLRWQGPTTIELRVESAAVKNGEFEIWISNDYLKRMNTETFFPVPKSVIVHVDRSSFVIPFRSDPSGTSFPIFLRWQAEEIGVHEGKIGLSGRDEVFEIRQIVYP